MKHYGCLFSSNKFTVISLYMCENWLVVLTQLRVLEPVWLLLVLIELVGVFVVLYGLTQEPGPGPGTSISGAIHSMSTRVIIGLANWLHVTYRLCVRAHWGGWALGRAEWGPGYSRTLFEVPA